MVIERTRTHVGLELAERKAWTAGESTDGPRFLFLTSCSIHSTFKLLRYHSTGSWNVVLTVLGGRTMLDERRILFGILDATVRDQAE